jgi:hypothetical protein
MLPLLLLLPLISAQNTTMAVSSTPITTSASSNQTTTNPMAVPGQLLPPLSLTLPVVTSLSPSSGSTIGGYNVSVLGSRFLLSSSFVVQLGSSNCSSTVYVSDSSLTCVSAPSGVGRALPVRVWQGMVTNVAMNNVTWNYNRLPHHVVL